MSRLASTPILRPHRIPNAIYRLRPPKTVAAFSPSYQLTNPRAFASSNFQLLLSRPVTRPQLPFLHPSSATTTSAHLQKVTLQTHVARFLSTDRRARWRAKLRWQLKFAAYFWSMVALAILAVSGIDQAKLERDYPTPREWSFWSRWYLRSAKKSEFEESAKATRVLVDWMRVAFFTDMLLKRLEDPMIDGGSLLGQGDDGSGILVEGIGRTGFDITMKSEPWRRGYYEALMGAARVAEHLEGFVRTKNRTSDKRRYLTWPKECVKSPDNPRPRPVPFGERECPPPEEVEDAWEDPRVWYMRILTTKGFSNRQRLDAAIAYADWLDFKGLTETAESMYDWALDIAAGGLPVGVGADGVVDMKTGILNPNKTRLVSENLLKATTALAVHHAQKGDVKAALPIFLSVLKARKELPAEPLHEAHRKEDLERKKKEDEGWWTYYYALRDWVVDAPYPPRPSDGDSQPFHTLKEACEEVGLMTYIGEILYATSSKEKGLSWTRDAVEAAEAVMWVMTEEKKEDGKERCRECLATGLDNWKKMAKSMAIAAETKERDEIRNPGWFGGGREKAAREARKWEEEEAQIELRKQKTMPLIHPLKPVPAGWFSV